MALERACAREQTETLGAKVRVGNGLLPILKHPGANASKSTRHKSIRKLCRAEERHRALFPGHLPEL